MCFSRDGEKKKKTRKLLTKPCIDCGYSLSCFTRNSGRNAYKANQNHLPISVYLEHPSVSYFSSVGLDLC